MKPTISIIHPSRGRPDLAFSTAREWIANATHSKIQYIISIDDNDPDVKKYWNVFNDLILNEPFVGVSQGPNQNVIDAMNMGAKYATGDLLVCISDDMHPFDCWDLEIFKLINPGIEQALIVHDGFDNHRPMPSFMPMPILTKRLYDKLGFVYFPEYTGMFADNDLYEMCDVMGVLVNGENLTFEHRHYTNPKNKVKQDATYRRHNTRTSWDIGMHLLHERRKNNFGIK